MRSVSRWLCAAVAGLAMAGFGSAPASAATTAPHEYNACPSEWVYEVTSVGGNTFYALPGGTYKDYNGTPYNAIATFNATVSGTIGTSVSLGGSFNISAIVAGAQLTTSSTLSASVTAGLNNSIAITVPPYRYGNGSWGAWRWKTAGHYYLLNTNCTESSSSYPTTYVPHIAPGWNTWISTT